MSDYLPDYIHLEIMKRLPVKSLIRFRSVSKTWKSVIGSSDFIIKHYKCHHTHSHSQHLLLKCIHRTWGADPIDNRYVSVFDDGTFPEYVPILVKMIQYPCVVIGSSHGLMCLHDRKKGVVLLWNVSIRKVVAVFEPRHLLDNTVLGFGVCGETNDPKIVIVDRLEYDDIPSIINIQVFTLSTGAWRYLDGNLPRESISFCLFGSSGVVINGVYYWLANDRNSMDGDHRKYVIISFDMTSEEFGEITVPCSLSYAEIFKLRESLVVVDRHEHCDGYYNHDIWMMGDGVPKSFTKLFSFTTKRKEGIIGFRKNGEPIIDGGEELVVYDPCKKRFNSLGIEGSRRSFKAYDYMKTLLLLDKPNFMVYNDYDSEELNCI